MAWYNDIGWWTGDTQRREAADAANQQSLTAAGMAQTGAESLAKVMESGFASQLPWLQRAIDQLQQEYQGRQGAIGSGVQQAIGAVNQGEAAMQQAAAAQDAKKLGLVREGMGLDQSTLQNFLNQTLASQSPYAAGYQQLLGQSLAPYLAAISGGQGLPVSGMAQQSLADTSRSLKAAMQKQGLSGSGMAAAQEAAARSRVINEDQQSQLARYLQNIQLGLGGANLTANAIAPYAQAMGNLGSRLSSVNPYDVASEMSRNAQSRANTYNQATQMSQSAQSGLPQAYASLGDFYYAQKVNPESVRRQGTNAYAQAYGSQAIPQSTSGLGLIGDALQVYSGLKGAFGGGSGGSVSNPNWYYNMPMSAQAQSR